MREIKFRAWDIEFKRMKVTGMGINRGVLMGEEVDIMQYTGLKDKNGVEIYEGDRLEDPDFPDEPPLEVYFNEVVGCWEAKWEGVRGYEYDSLHEFNNESEVIGNIHEGVTNGN